MWKEYRRDNLLLYVREVDHISHTLKAFPTSKTINIDNCRNIRILLNRQNGTFALLNYDEHKFVFNDIIFWIKFIKSTQHQDSYKFIHLPRCDPVIHYSLHDLFNLICMWIIKNHTIRQSEYTISIVNHSIATVHSSNYGTVFAAFIQIR